MADMQFNDVFWKIYDAASLHPRYISNKGGTRSTKTYSTLQFLHLLIPKADKAGDITSVVSESFPHLKKGAIRDFENIIGHPLKGDPHWNATDNVWTYDNGAKLEFFSVDNAAKVHGSQRKRLFINEANHIAYEIFRQLAVRTSSIIFIDYNPSSVCWIQNEVESKSNCILIKSTYKDNPFLSAEQVREIEDQKSDANWWKVYGCGLEGTLDGLIFEFEQIDELPVKTEMDHLVEIQGLDFGFTNDPTARVQVIADPRKKILYVRNALRLRTIRIYLHPPADSIIRQVLYDMLVLHMRLIAPLPDIEDFLSRICNDLHPGSRIIGKSKVQSLYLHQVVHLRLDREFIYLLKLIDETIQCSLKSAPIHFPPIGITLLILNLPHLFCRQERVVLVCGLDEDAVLLTLHLILYPTHGCRVVVNEDDG